MNKITVLLSIFLILSCTNGLIPPPEITGFDLPDGGTTYDGTIPISVSDDGTATAWLITFSATPPSSDDSGWLSSKPTEVVLPDYGIFSLYPWARNSHDMVSDAYSPQTAEYAAPGPQVGEVIVTEIMADPAGDLPDTEGEWFELYNTTSSDLSLTGCRIHDEDNDTFEITGSLIIPATSYVVLAKSSDTESYMTPDYIYSSGMTLANSDDEIILTSSEGNQIDIVTYSSPAAGYSWQLKPDYFNATDNDNSENWSLSADEYYDDNYGTPGAANSQ